MELIRDTHKPTMAATPLIEPVIDASNAAVVSAPQPDPEKPFPTAAETHPFGVPIPAHGEAHQEQTQQEDYLWGV